MPLGWHIGLPVTETGQSLLSSLYSLDEGGYVLRPETRRISGTCHLQSLHTHFPMEISIRMTASFAPPCNGPLTFGRTYEYAIEYQAQLLTIVTHIQLWLGRGLFSPTTIYRIQGRLTRSQSTGQPMSCLFAARWYTMHSVRDQRE